MFKWTELLGQAGRTLLLLILCVTCTTYIVLRVIPADKSSTEPFLTPSNLPNRQSLGVGGTSASEPLEADMRALAEQNENLRSRLTRLQKQVEAMQLPQTLETQNDVQDAQKQEHSSAEEVQWMTHSDEHQYDFALLEEQFYAEPADAQWSATVQRDFDHIENQLNEHTDGATYIEYQECRSSTCRVEYAHEAAVPMLLPALIASPSNKQLFLQSVTVDGVTKTIALYRR